jgi:hypothetical protein
MQLRSGEQRTFITEFDWLIGSRAAPSNARLSRAGMADETGDRAGQVARSEGLQPSRAPRARSTALVTRLEKQRWWYSAAWSHNAGK